MDIINAYQETPRTHNLIYLAKPIYGGWVTFTGHLSRKYGYPIHKLTKHTETHPRNFGFGCKYKNLCLQDLIICESPLITAVDKSHWEYLQYFPNNTRIVIHDISECKQSKEGNPLVQQTKHGSLLLQTFDVYVVCESVKRYLQETYGITSTYLKYPFYAETIPPTMQGLSYKYVSIARIDFEKHSDILLQTNELLDPKKPKSHIYLFGAEHRIYVYHTLRPLGIQDYWMGKFAKQLIPQYKDGVSILKDAEFMIDLSTKTQGGGGIQYTFLEAIYQDCILVIHNEWIRASDIFISGVNCIGVSNKHDLAKLLQQGLTKHKKTTIRKNAKLILQDHLEVLW